ncbi:unnamed protein product, partial [Rotaria sp. Silwood2]
MVVTICEVLSENRDDKKPDVRNPIYLDI